MTKTDLIVKHFWVFNRPIGRCRNLAARLRAYNWHRKERYNYNIVWSSEVTDRSRFLWSRPRPVNSIRTWLFPRPSESMQIEKSMLSKSSTLTRTITRSFNCSNITFVWAGKVWLLIGRRETWWTSLVSRTCILDASLAFSGSNQARKGRLVNALAVRGDERRDTLR